MTSFVQVFSSGATAVTAGGGTGGHSIVLKEDGSVWITGKNQHGQLGDGSTSDRQRFLKVISGNAKAVAAGSKHSLVVKEDGSVWATGCNMYGQLGDGSTVDKFWFVQVFIAPYGVKAVAAGVEHSLVLGQNGTAWAAGANFYGQLGDASITSTNRFVQVLSAEAHAIAAGGHHSMVVKQDGSVWVTGANQYGQLGDGSTNAIKSMHEATKNSMQSFNAKAVAAGLFHSLVLEREGSVWTAGSNNYGQLGDGSRTSKREFVRVIGRVQAVAAGGWHSMILKHDGSFWSTGKNSEGQLGDGSTNERHKFVRVAEITTKGA